MYTLVQGTTRSVVCTSTNDGVISCSVDFTTSSVYTTTSVNFTTSSYMTTKISNNGVMYYYNYS